MRKGKWLFMAPLLILAACSQNQEPTTQNSTNIELETQATVGGGWQLPRQAPYVDFYYNSSVSTYGFTAAADFAIPQWNGITSKIIVRKVASYSAVTTNTISAVDAFSPDGSAIWGTAFGYRLDASGNPYYEPNNNLSNVQHRIVLYKKRFDTLAAFPVYENRKKQILVHEIGHTLKLAHTTTSDSSIMSSDSYPSPTSANTPQAYDRGQLVQKWGQ